MQTLISKYYSIALAVFMASFFWGHAVVNIAFVLLTLIHIFLWIQQKPKLSFDLILLPLIAFFALFVLSWAMAPAEQAAINSVERSLHYPLIVLNMWLGMHFYTPKHVRVAQLAFVVSNLLSSIFLLFLAMQKTWIYGSVNPFFTANGNHFSYHNLTAPLNFHAVYYGLFCLMSIVFMLGFVRKKQKVNYQNWMIVTIVYLSIIVLLLSSFMLVILLFAVFLLFIILYFREQEFQFSFNWRNGLIALGVMFLIGIGSLFIIEKSKGVSLTQDFVIENISGQEFTAVRARVMKAYCSWQLIKEKPFAGYSTAYAQKELRQSYLDHGFVHGFEENYNPHNQYLSILLQFGVIGLLILGLYLFFFLQGANYNSYWTWAFLIICLGVFVSESILERQHGVLWFAFFSSFVYFARKKSLE